MTVRLETNEPLTLAQSEEQFRLLVQSVTDYAIFMLDVNGVVSNWNAGARRIKGYTAPEIVGKHFSIFYSDEDRQAGLPWRGLKTAAEEGRFEHEGWRHRKDGSRFWANVVIDRIVDDHGKLLGFAKVTRDMTERRETQLALEKARDAMAQSQKMDAIGQLTGGVAHDFNNLLMAVLGSLELLDRRLPDDPKLKKLLNNAFEGARRGVTLTQRMLSFARRRELALAAIDVAALIDGIMNLLERSLGPMISVEADLPANLPPIKADVNQLETGILNLALNSRDAMPRGGLIKIHARLETGKERLAAQGLTENCVVLSVSDSGEGMDEITARRAMEPFFTTKGIGKGTGLGLSMVHGMTEQLGGRMSLSSEVGRGTTVELWLPVSGEAILANPAPVVTNAPAPATRRLVTVVVDDDQLVLTNTAAMLEDCGHKVLEAVSGAQALEVMRTGVPVDLVITDQAMPHMTGMELAAAIRAEWPTLPILLVSGFAELPADDPLKIPKLGKPYSLRDLRHAVDSLTQPGVDDEEQFGSTYRD